MGHFCPSGDLGERNQSASCKAHEKQNAVTLNVGYSHSNLV